MARKKNVALPHFGSYLRTLRLLKNIGTQQKVAQLLHRRGLKKISQGLIAKYEKGDICDPNPDVLLALAKVYGIDYVEMVLQLVEEKYVPGGKKWGIIRNALPRTECGFCKLIKTSIDEMSAAHKH